MKANIFEFFLIGALLALFVALGAAIMMTPAHTEHAVMLSIFLGAIFAAFPLFIAALFGADWIEDNISVD